MVSFCLGQEGDLGGGAARRSPRSSIITCMCQHVRWPFKREGPGFGEPEKSWASWKEGKDGRVQVPAHRVWGTGGADCGDGAAGGR